MHRPPCRGSNSGRAASKAAAPASEAIKAVGSDCPRGRLTGHRGHTSLARVPFGLICEHGPAWTEGRASHFMPDRRNG
ncbi:unnamed protein product [Protopolystoma xenopodis]|uniref:Uncharacterized protein n=1 Tax=Protopolystoma xenopodis TaxID=117903 RepID=A0A448WJT5_9PLAT|nr:unnamed protein product [Protopolystoma xenopodis]